MQALAESVLKRILRATAHAFAVGFAREMAWRAARNLMRTETPPKRKKRVRR